MKHSILILFSILSISLTAQLPDIGDASNKAQKIFDQANLSSEKIQELVANFGVDMVLDLATDKAFQNDAQIFIPLPTEYNSIKEKVVRYGGEKLVNSVETKLNEAAEQTIEYAKPHIKSAVQGLTLASIVDILANNKNGLTNYLENRSYQNIVSDLEPIVKNKLSETGTYQGLNDVFKLYRRYAGFFGRSIPDGPDLETYVAQKAARALFIKLAQREASFRAEKLSLLMRN